MKNIRNAIKLNKILLPVLILIFIAGTVNAANEIINLSTGADLTINGIDANDQSGMSISSGDINGDGIWDVIIGARSADPNGESSGETYVVFGGVIGEINLSTDADLIINGIDTMDLSGNSVSSGDINGDGKDDVIIGAYEADPNGISRAGETYVVFGGTTGVIDLSTDANLTINGVFEVDFSGESVSSGDINGDGKDDVIIGASWADPNGLSSGETYVVFGGVTGEINLSTDANLTIKGIVANDMSGISISSGDINGDGKDDVIIGAHVADPNGNSAAGETYVVFGGVTGEINLSTDANLTINGIDIEDYSGRAVSSGDINGDGIDDVIIAASYADPNGNSAAGETYVVFGGVTGEINLSTDANLTINGINASDQSGYSVSSGDINGDGKDDVIIGARYADPNGDYSGETYVVFGGVTGEINLSTGADFRINGIDASDFSSYSISSGDINGDGKFDVIIGAYGADPNGLTSGETYVVFGSSDSTEPTYSDFTSSESTNFSDVTLSSVANLTLAIDNKGKIAFPSDHNVNAENEDYNTNVKIEDAMIYVNSAALDSSFNDSATLTFYNVDCNAPYVFYSETASTFATILSENQRCPESLCTDIQCSAGTLTVNVSHFSGYASGTNANLTIEAESGVKMPSDPIEFYAWYVNSTDGTQISGECNISFDDNWGTWFEMDYNGSEYNYTKSLGFAAPGTHHYNVTCSSASFVTLEANDTKVISSIDIPEFSTITLGLGLIAVLGGLIIIRRRN